MSNLKNLTGMTFNRLYVIKRVSNDKSGRARWLCKCECGTIKVILGKHLLSRKVQSCGCLQKERVTKHKMSNSRLYSIYRGMKDRCYNQNMPEYHNYGGRGITICDAWLNDPSSFFKWSLENGYSDDLTIDRKDNDKGYSPENCWWTTEIEQHNNTRRNRYVEYKGEVHTLAEWCRILDLNYSTVKTRLNVLKWSVEEAFER